MAIYWRGDNVRVLQPDAAAATVNPYGIASVSGTHHRRHKIWEAKTGRTSENTPGHRL